MCHLIAHLSGLEDSYHLCDASNKLNSTDTKEEEWQDGGTTIDETIEV